MSEYIPFPVGSVQEGTYSSSTTIIDHGPGRAQAFNDFSEMGEEEFQVHKAMLDAQNAKYEAEMAEVAETEEEAALLEGVEAGEEGLMEAEALAGPWGWAAEIVTGVALAATAVALGLALASEARELEQANADKPPQLPAPPTPRPIPSGVVGRPGVVNQALRFDQPYYPYQMGAKKRRRV